MAQRNFGCDAKRLRLLLDDSLPTNKQAEVVHHLDDCRDCQATLERLAADKSWWDELPQLNTLDARALVHAAGTEPTAAVAKGARVPEPSDGPFALDFLDAAENVDDLGRLDRFAVTSVLGRGGMGVVLKAFDASLNRPVAIKVLAPYFASSGAARQRFDREAKAAATVVHPHVVAIHSVDSWKGLPYLVMSYVAGRSLQERLDANGPLDVKEIVRIGMQTASGLAAAHAQGLVHRDVKPANILLEDTIGRVWLTDFGLARAVDDASLTQSGVIAGTPQYMAPEQAKGEAVDHRADLFSLGSTLYAMCTAHPPFRAESALAVLRRVCDDRARPVRSLNPDIPGFLAGIIERLHAKNPDERFQSAAEVADLLGKCLAHLQQPETLPLPPEVAGFTSPRKRKRRFNRPVAAIVVLLASIGAAAVCAWLLRDQDRIPDRSALKVGNDEQRLSKLSLTPNLDEGTLEGQTQRIRGQAVALETDMKQLAVTGYGDPMDALVRETWRRLDVLERELAIRP